jgi:hypothetical protein
MVPHMTYEPRRPVSELPFSGTDIMLRYHFEHPATAWEFDDTLEIWSVSISRYHSDECLDCLDEETCEVVTSGPSIGHMSFVRIRDFTGDPGWEAADSYSGDIEKVVAVCTDPEHVMTPGLHWSEAFEEAIEMPVGDLLIMDRVWIEPQWRGFGIGPLAASEVIRRLAGGCCAVACVPAPTDRDFGDDKAAYAKAQAKIAKAWEAVGFEPFTRGVYLLDPALRHAADCRERWQKRFGR